MFNIVVLIILLVGGFKIQASNVDDLIRVTTEYYEEQAKIEKIITTIVNVDNFSHVITLSNGRELLYFAYYEETVASWLNGQPVRLEIGRKRGVIKLVNLETKEWIEVVE